MFVNIVGIWINTSSLAMEDNIHTKKQGILSLACALRSLSSSWSDCLEVGKKPRKYYFTNKNHLVTIIIIIMFLNSSYSSNEQHI